MSLRVEVRIPQSRARRELRSLMLHTVPVANVVVTRLGEPIAVIVSARWIHQIDELRDALRTVDAPGGA